MLLSSGFANNCLSAQPRFFGTALTCRILTACFLVSRVLIAVTAFSQEGDGVSGNSTASNSTGAANATCQPCLISPQVFESSHNGQSEIFEISTRHLPDHFQAINFDGPNVEVNRWQGNRWARSSVEDAMPQSDGGMLSIIYVHGNFMERNNALNRVRIVDSYLRAQTNRSYRLVMLSWPSQRERKPLRDVFSNNEAAECESLYVAWMLSRLRDHGQVSLLGFSFGAKAVTGGLHMDAGGTLPGFAPSPVEPNSQDHLYRLGLVAPAVDRQWLMPNGRHQLAFTNVDGVVNMYNSRDPILRRFRFLDRLTQPIAAGFAGIEPAFTPRVTSPLTGQSAIRQYDCGSVIGTTHSERSYYGECPYFRTLIRHVLWEESDPVQSNVCVSQ